MIRQSHVLWCGGLVLVCCLSAAIWAVRSTSDNEVAKLLNGTRFHADVGVQMSSPEASVFTVPIRITNESECGIDVQETRASCSCTQVQLTRGHVEPHGEFQAILTFKKPAGEYGGYFDGEIVIKTKDGKRAGFFVVEYAGVHLLPALVMPSRLNFGTLLAGQGSHTQKFEVLVPHIVPRDGHLVYEGDSRVVRVQVPDGVTCVQDASSASENAETGQITLTPAFMNLDEKKLSVTQSEIKQLLAKSGAQGQVNWQSFHFVAAATESFLSDHGTIDIELSNGTSVHVPLVVQKKNLLTLVPSTIAMVSAMAKPASLQAESTDGGPLEVVGIATGTPQLTASIDRISPSRVRIVLSPPAKGFNGTKLETTIEIETNIGKVRVPYRQWVDPS